MDGSKSTSRDLPPAAFWAVALWGRRLFAVSRHCGPSSWAVVVGRRRGLFVMGRRRHALSPYGGQCAQQSVAGAAGIGLLSVHDDHPFKGRLARRARPPLHAMRMAARPSRARGKTRRVGGERRPGGAAAGRSPGDTYSAPPRGAKALAEGEAVALRRAVRKRWLERFPVRRGRRWRDGGMRGKVMVAFRYEKGCRWRDGGARGKCAGAAQGGRGQFPARQGSPVARWRDAWGCHGYGAGRLRTLSDTTRIADVRWRDAWGDRGCGERRPQASLARPSQTLCKLPEKCRIEALHRR